MKKFAVTLFAAALLSTSALSSVRAEAPKGEIPVDRVILSTSGLANFVHRMEVKDNANVEFPVRFEQVDDILKSLVIFDRKGRLGGVTLPGKQPLEQVFKDLPFTQAQLSNPMLLINAYQGATITLKGGGNAAQLVGGGGVLGVIDADDCTAAEVERIVERPRLGPEGTVGNHNRPDPWRKAGRGQCGTGLAVAFLDGQHDMALACSLPVGIGPARGRVE